MTATGLANGPALVCPSPIAAAADGALLALRALAADPRRLPAQGALLLGERARLMGLSRAGRTSPNGSCRLLDAVDGPIAINLPRADDWTLLPALLDGAVPNDWDSLGAEIRSRSSTDLEARGADLGLALARALPASPQPWLRCKPGASARSDHAPRVLDLSSLWAGPLCGALLTMLGADVVKLEDRDRPDGARRGHAGFFALLNAAKSGLTLSLRQDTARLRALVRGADIVIEASRPRALRQLGVDAEAEVARGAIWISITGHGRMAGERIGFGDDCAVAGGLASVMAAGWGEPMMVGDAIADPLTGLHAALAAWAYWRLGEGALIDLALSGVVAHAVATLPSFPDLAGAQATAERDAAPLYPLRDVPPAPHAPSWATSC